ncbi:MAG: glutathione S-transferase family protein [Gammaproteobacteria bacterium]|nr:glutathione S-transferase family protein [Gammaproteobacteria bacterium]
MLALYHWEPNANSGKPMLALAEKGVAFESRYLDLLSFDQHQPEYLKVNPNGTIPAMVHDDLVLTESTAIMEYVDAAFPGPPLRPRDPLERWRMRWWMKYFDQYFGPSLSMIGWSLFVGPSVRSRDPAQLKAAIERIPLKERRIAWSKAIYGTFSPEELAESRRRVQGGVAQLEAALTRRPWLAGSSYSLADMNAFNNAFGLPLTVPEACNEQTTPHILEWLRRIYERPATQRIWAMGRTPLAARVAYLKRT